MWEIWWPKTVSLFDVWSIDHFIAGIWVWALAISIVNKIIKKYKLRSDIEEKDNVSEWVSEWDSLLINLFLLLL